LISSSAVSSTQARRSDAPPGPGRRRSTPLPRPVAVSKAKIASIVRMPARVTTRGGQRSGAMRKPVGSAAGRVRASVSAMSSAPLRVAMSQVKASTSRQCPSGRNSAAAASASRRERARSNASSQADVAAWGVIPARAFVSGTWASSDGSVGRRQGD
jgi:hypothetical protein